MTIAPEPGTRMVWMSVRFGICNPLAHECKEFAKNIMRVMRTGRGLGMELHAQYRFVFESQTFKRVIVQTLVRDFNFIEIQIASRDAVIMILRCNKHFTR